MTAVQAASSQELAEAHSSCLTQILAADGELQQKQLQLKMKRSDLANAEQALLAVGEEVRSAQEPALRR